LERRTSNQDGFAISPGSQAVALFAYSLASFFPAFMSSAVNIALPSINQEFHADAVVLSWLVTSFVLALAVLSLPFGRIADILGIKKIFVLGIIIFILASAAASFSNTIIMLILCRAAQSIGSAMIIGNSIALVTALYPANRRGRALGINLACVFIGMSLGPFLGGVLTQHLGWRSIFLINIPAGLLAIALILWKVKVEWSESKGEKFDIAGSIIYGLSLVALIYGFTLLPDLPGAVLIGAAILGLFAFIRWENRTPSPILNVGLFRQNRTFVFSNLAGLICSSGSYALIFLLSLYLQYVKGLTAEQAGFIMVAQPAVQALLSPFVGRLSEKIEPRIVASAGMALTLLGMMVFIFISEDTSLAQIIIALIVVGTGLALFVSPNVNLIMSSVTPKYYAVASAVAGTLGGVGRALSMGIATVVIALVLGRVIISPEYHTTFLTSTRITFAILSGLSLAGVVASYYGGRARR